MLSIICGHEIIDQRSGTVQPPETPQIRVQSRLCRENKDLRREEIASQQRVKVILGIVKEADVKDEHKELVFAELEKYGLGTKRTREEFRVASGVDFATGTASDAALWGGHPKTIFAENLADLLAAASSSSTTS